MNKNISYVALLFFQLFVCNEFQASDKPSSTRAISGSIQKNTSEGGMSVGAKPVQGFELRAGFGVALVPYCSNAPQESFLVETRAASLASSPSSTSLLRRHSPTMPLEGRSPSPLARFSEDEFKGNVLNVDPRALADSVVVPSTGIVAPTPQPAFARTVQTIQGHQFVSSACCGCFGNK